MSINWDSTPELKVLLDFRKAIEDLDAHLRSIANSGDRQLIVDALVIAHAIKSDIGNAFTDYQAAIGNSLPVGDEIAASNGQIIEKRVSSDRRGWQHKDLIEEVYRRVSKMAVDMDTGEVTSTPQEIAMKILDYVQPSYWRVKELSKIGINADHYCEVGDIKTSISIKKLETK